MAMDPVKILQAEKQALKNKPALVNRQQKAEQKAIQKEKAILEEEKVFRQGVVSIKDLIAPAAMEVTPTFLKLGQKFVRTIFVITYPRYISIGWFAPIINLSSQVDISMYFYPIKPEIILKQLRNKVGALEAQMMGDREKGAPRDPMRETALRDIEKLRDDITQGVEHFFQFGLY